MPRVSILDSILNRPSQSYTPEIVDNNSQRRNHNGGIRFAAPPDLPNAAGRPSSILSGNMFSRKPSRNYSRGTSDAGRSTAGSISGGSIFGRSRTSRDYGSQYAPSSIADSQATNSKKGRWWETGSMTFGRRSRAPSISGNSIYSQPADDGLNTWPSMMNASQSPRHRVSQSDYGGGSRSNRAVPPMPKLDDRYYTSQNGRLQSNVAPLGNSTLNPTLTKKPSKQRVTSSSLAGLGSNQNGSLRRISSPPPSNRDGAMGPPSRAFSPPPSNRDGAMSPSSRAFSPPPRPLSPTFSDSGRSMRSMTTIQNGAQDWKDFVKGMSGSQVSKVWEGDANVSSIGAALNNSKATNTVERRKSNMMRLQKELEQDAQHDQVIRDPGIIHQDLLARAASQVVGSPPAVNYGDADLLGSSIRPGSIVSPPSNVGEHSRSSPPMQQTAHPLQQQQQQQLQEQQRQQQVPATTRYVNGAHGLSNGAVEPIEKVPAAIVMPELNSISAKQPVQQPEVLPPSDESDSEADTSDEDDESEESERQRQHLAVVDEEEEESTSSLGHEMRPHQSAVMTESALATATATTSAARFPAFDAHLKKSNEAEHSSPKIGAMPLLGASPYPAVNGELSSSERSPTSVESIIPPQTTTHEEIKSVPQVITILEESAQSMDRQESTTSDVDAHDLETNEKTTDRLQAKEDDDKATHSIISTSTQTGKATVKFDHDAKSVSIHSDGTISRPKSINGSTRSGSRPPTLSRRLSDVSMGTSFGMSKIMPGSSRSSARMRMADNDSDSAKSGSDDEGNDELKSKIKAEQDRLRNMKVGEDFFGGSLSSILDKFGASTSDDESRNTVGRLDLDVGSSGRANGGIMSTQQILTLNAQERINEVRRLRTDSSRSVRGMRDSDAMTVQSGIAPSFAAIWLLNQDGASTPPATQSSVPITPPAPTRAAPATPQSHEDQAKGHTRHVSSTSSEGNTGSTTTTNRLKNFFSSKPVPISTTEPVAERRTSVMDRPRNRGAKPRQMGGVPISQGKLNADEIKLEQKEDTRSTLPGLVTSQTLSQMQAKQQAKAAQLADTSSLSMAPSTSMTSNSSITSPISPSVPVSELPASKDKPAPIKSALKPKKSKSLADTLFSFASTSPKKLAKKHEAKEAKRAQIDDEKSMKSINSVDSIANSSDAKAAKTSPQRSITRTRSGSGSVYATPDKELDLYSFPSSNEMSTFHTAQDLTASKSDGIYEHPLQRRAKATPQQKKDAEKEEEVWEPALPSQPTLVDTSSTSPKATFAKVEEIPSSSEANSVASTGPATPVAMDSLDRTSSPRILTSTIPTLIARRSESPKLRSSPADKKLPMPPMPNFHNSVLPTNAEGDSTPLAVARSEPFYIDDNKTPNAETVEPSFGMNLIPPTPPALDNGQQNTSTTSSKLVGTKPDTVLEQAEDDDEYHKSRSSTSDAGERRDIKKTGSIAGYEEYKGRGINLPAGLTLTTVARSSSRRNNEMPPRFLIDTTETSTDGTITKKKRAKDNSSSRSPSRSNLDAVTSESSGRQDSSQHSSLSPRRSSLALRESLADAPPVPHLPTSASNLTIPSSQSETNSSNGSDSAPRSYTGSPSPSPAPSVSGRSAISSSNASMSAASEQSNSRFPRKIRTLSAAPNGQARTSLMSAINEWESSSPVERGRGGAMSPMPVYMDSSRSEQNHSRTQSNSMMGYSPSIGSSAERPLHSRINGVRSSSGQTESLDGHGQRRPWRGSYAPSESDMSNLGREQPSLSTPYIPSAPQSLAGYKHHDAVKASNTIDDRLYAKTTMTTISVTSGAFRSKSLKKRKSSADMTNLGQGDSARSSRVSIDTMSEALTEELQRTTMSLTAHTPPPRKLTSTQLLVQIMTCAIDETDRQLLREKIRSENAYGFVPGRSFCGRVMETGWEVKKIRKGDVVFGLQSSRKCGALAEFMTIDQNLIAKAPEDCLTTEEIAALPAVGVMAYQMMTNHCSQLKRGSRILILNAHDGVGLLTMQEAANLGLIIVAQCPTNISDGLALCEANGANEVVVGDPLWALNSLHESSFDLVLDTVGGRRVYDAARRILAYEGQFCTCVGDMSSSVNPNLKSHFRSLRRSFFKKDTKHIGYEWLAIDVGEDCREALESVKQAAERGLICPRLQSILPFEDAPRAFEVTLRGGQTEPGSVVVKIS